MNPDPPSSFDRAIRHHLQLKRRNAPLPDLGPDHSSAPPPLAAPIWLLGESIPSTSGPSHEMAVSVQRLSKRYRVGSRAATVPVPSLMPWRSTEPRQRERSRYADPVDEDDDEVEEEDDEEIERPEGPPRTIWALRDISFEVRRGGSLGIIGPNGGGKTTLLKILARITAPTSGRAVLHGRVAPLIELASSFMQPHLTGRRNVYLLASFFGVPDEVVNRRLDDIVAFADLDDLIDTPAKHYSSGLYRRLAFSVALNLEPDVLLADEVLAVGDSAFRERCLEHVREAAERGLTVLFATHDRELVQRMCDQAIWLEGGRVTEFGDTEDVLRRIERRTRPTAPTETAAATAPGPGASSAERAGAVAAGSGAPARKKHSFNEYAAIVAAGIFSEGGFPIETLRADETAVIALTIEAATSGIRVKCGVELYLDGRPRVRLVHRKPFQLGRPGPYTARVHVPAGVLGEGFYAGRVGAVVYAEGAEHPIVRRNAFSFEAYRPEDEADDADEQPEPGDIVELADLAWEIERDPESWREPTDPARPKRYAEVRSSEDPDAG